MKITKIFSNTINNIRLKLNTWFQWDKAQDELIEKSKQEPRRPKQNDLTDSPVANVALTKGLYYNTYPGLKLAGSLAYKPIAVPVWFMGLPIPISEDEEEQKILNNILETYITKLKQIHLEANRDGTIWVFPWYSAKLEKTMFEIIPDDLVTDIIRDIETKEIIEIITYEEIKVSTGYDTTATVRKKTYYRKDYITIEFQIVSGILPRGLNNKRMRNPIGILPIPFANNKEAGKVRGHSDLERILPDLKDYHDISLAWSRQLAKFNIKMVQEVQNVDDWKKQNGIDALNELEIYNLDFILNLKDRESTSFIFPQGAYEAYEKKLQNGFWKLIEGSGIPEILWGPNATGNYASSEEAMGVLVKFVHDKQAQYTESHKILFTALLQLELIARMGNLRSEVIIKWNAMDAISEKVKSEIFNNFASAISQLVNIAGITKEQLYKIWLMWYPGATDEDFNIFIWGLSDMAVFKQFQNADYGEALGIINGEGNKP